MEKKIFKFTVAILASAYFFYYASTPETWHFIDGVNLIIHEAGHWIFWPFGEFMHILGGSLNQVLVPVIFTVYFYLQSQKYSAALTLFWVGQNFINVSVYAGDAVRMQLPLLGGEGVIHDWNWLLIYVGELHHTTGIAMAIKAIGLGLILLAAIGSCYYALTDEQKNF